MLAEIFSSHRVSAAEFVRGFGLWRERASETPVTITNHGRDTHVLLSAKTFAALAVPTGIPGSGAVVTPELADTLLDKVRECILIIDHDFVVQRANTAACDFFSCSSAQMVGCPLERAMPNMRQSFALHNVVRTLVNRERSAIDVPSVMHDGLWLHIESFPVEPGAAIFFRDITTEVETHRVADVKQAVIEAMSADGHIGYARISPREMVQCADGALRGMLGVNEVALQRAKFSSVIPTRARGAFHEALETVFQQHVGVQLDSAVMSNSGHEIPVRLSIVELRGGYSSEGAIVAVTQLPHTEMA